MSKLDSLDKFVWYPHDLIKRFTHCQRGVDSQKIRSLKQTLSILVLALEIPYAVCVSLPVSHCTEQIRRRVRNNIQ